MAGLRKSRRSRRTKRKSRVSRSRKYRGGGTVTIYFKLAPTGVVSNVFSSDPGFTVEAVSPPSMAGKINVKGVSTSKITGFDVKAIPEGSQTTGWASNLMSPKIGGPTKFTLSKGTVSLMGRTAVAIPAAGVALTDNLNINNLLGTANWSASKQPHPVGAVPPGAPPGTTEANIRLTLTTVP